MVKLATFGKRYARSLVRKAADYNTNVNNCPAVHRKTVENMNNNLREIKTHSRNFFEKAVESVQPHNIIKGNLRLTGNKLHVQNKSYSVNQNCYLVGFGKAVLGMALETEHILGNDLVSGIISIPVGILDTFKNLPHLVPKKNTKLQFIEGAENNLPDDNSLSASRQIEALVRNLNENDLLIVLISGGGSALLPAPIAPLTIREKYDTIKFLSSAGANIMELNCVRKRLSYLKGGGLARLAYPAQVVALILSDVVGDELGYIASGPTVENTDQIDDALNIIKKYGLLDKIPTSVNTILSNKSSYVTGSLPQTQNLIIGNNGIALQCAATEASRNGYYPVILTKSIFQSVEEVCRAYILLTTNICKFLNGQMSEKKLLNSFDAAVYKIPLDADSKENLLKGLYSFNESKGLCLLAGGETTVVVKGKGKGGRNQELALLFSVALEAAFKENHGFHKYNILLLSAGTDGIDGPTEAAGAIGYAQQVEAAARQNLDISQYLENNDSHNFYQKLGITDDLIVTGHTGTNVMDIHIIIVQAVQNHN